MYGANPDDTTFQTIYRQIVQSAIDDARRTAQDSRQIRERSRQIRRRTIDYIQVAEQSQKTPPLS